MNEKDERENSEKKKLPQEASGIGDTISDVGKSFVKGTEDLVTGTMKGATEAAEKLAGGIGDASRDLIQEGPILGVAPAAGHIAKGAVEGVVEGTKETTKREGI